MTVKRYTTSERLAEAMQIRHVNQADIIRLAKPFCDAHNLKMNKSDMSQFVNGKIVPSQRKLSILASALDVSEVWLMGYDVPMERTYINEKVPGDTPELDEFLIQQLSSLTPAQVQFVRDFLDLPESQAQRVMDFLAGLKAAERS